VFTYLATRQLAQQPKPNSVATLSISRAGIA
jgi:hypothetical protein